MSAELAATHDELASRRNRRPPHAAFVPSSLPVPVPLPAHTALDGTRVRLEPPGLVPRDASALWTATHGDPEREETWRYLSYGPFPDVEDFEAWYTACGDSTDPMWFVAVEAPTGRPVGMAAFMRITPQHAVIEVGNIWFVRDVSGTALTTEAIFHLMHHAMASGYRRVEWKCDAANLPSRSAALRLGFRYEGVFRNHMVIKGRNRDTAWFSILGEEWSAVRAVIEAWLDPANFDSAGQARTSLRTATAALW